MALYTKIKGPVNYTVVGTPTINNGVVSGFSANNYLTTQNGFSPNRCIWEFQCYIKYVAGSAKQSLIDKSTGSGGTRNFQIAINADKTLTFYVSFDGTSKSIESTGTYTLTSNNYYYIRLKFTGTQYILSVSTDGYTWIDDITINNSNYIYGNVINIIGKNGVDREIFNGSINLNKTYININGTAWFGSSFSKVKVKSGLARYTAVGSPTITNGIASGFSTSNYLKIAIPSGCQSNIKKSFEIQTKITMPDTLPTYSQFFYFPIKGTSAGLCYSGTRLIFSIYSSTYRIRSNTDIIQTNETLWIKGTIKNNIAELLTSSDGVNWTSHGTLDITDMPTDFDTSDAKIGINGNRSSEWIFPGSIYLNETYIKINDNYFFRGSKQDILGYKIQQDNFSKYYTIVDGKLTWASPDIYLESSSDNYGGDGIYAKQWINTNYIPSQGIEYEIDFTLFTSETSANNSYIMGTNCFGLEGHWNNNSNNALIYFNDNYTFTMTRNERHKVAIKKQNDNYNFYLDNVLQTTFTELTIAPTRKMYLFALNAYNSGRAAYASYSRIYKYKIWDNGTLLYHFVPVPKGLLIGNFVVPSNGMFDIVEQKFYGNEGTGDFAIGGIPQDYIIEGGKMIWCNPNIYLESTGTQYINSNFVPTNYSKWVLDAQFTDTSINSWNGRYNTTSSPQRFDIALSANSYVINGGNTTSFSGILTADTNRHTFILDMINEKGIIDNTYEINLSTVTMTSTKTVKIFARQGSSSIESYCREKIYSSQFYEKQTIEQYLVPVPKGMLIGDKIAPSNCMFDLVTQTFFTNQRTGDFIIGGISGDYINIGDNIVWVDNNVYLQSSGEKYIDTNIKPTNLTVIEGKVMLMEINKCIYGSRTSKSDSDIHDWIVNTATTNFPQFGSDDSSITYSWNLNQTYIIKNGQNGAYINGSSVRSYNTYTFSSTWNMYLFGLNQAGSLESRSLIGRVYNFQIIENTKLIRYFIPVNTNTVIGSFTVPAPGMWDAVTKKFYPNKGSGSFTYGKDS